MATISGFIIILITAIIIYVSIFIYRSLDNLSKRHEETSDTVNISVIVALKNESANIQSLVKNLSCLDYPESRLEIILVDDNSSDNSGDILRRLTEGNKLFSIFSIRDKLYPGKKGALAFGIEKAKNNYIMITDADCSPGKDWLKYAAGSFSLGYDFIMGIAPLYCGNSVVQKISSLENLRSTLLTFGLGHKGFYYSASARNFGFRKDSFLKLKGYSQTLQTLSGDDDLLLREAVSNGMRIGMFVSDKSMVYSDSKTIFTQYLRQRSRHTKTSLYYRRSSQAILGIWHTSNIIALLSVTAAFINVLFAVPFVVKMSCDLILIKRFSGFAGCRFKLSEILYLQALYELLLVLHLFNALFRRDTWK